MAQNDPGLSSLGPLDGRYKSITEPLAQLFCEASLIQHRHLVEIEWLLVLDRIFKPKPRPTKGQLAKVASFKDVGMMPLARAVKELEKQTNHDLKAVELHIARRLSKAGLSQLSPLVHLGCTSWDINNIAYALMLKRANDKIMVPALREIQALLESLAMKHASLPMLGRTHGQPASPTTFGKEMRVFAERLRCQADQMERHLFVAKMNGAVGNYSAFKIASPKANWISITKGFVKGFGLGWASHTTQLGDYESFVEYFDALFRANMVLLDLSEDMSHYMMIGNVGLHTRKSEVGSSTMPHKVNPIDFENAEGNIGMANASLRHFAAKLPVSRLQRDLSDSTVARNFGVAFGHCHCRV